MIEIRELHYSYNNSFTLDVSNVLIKKGNICALLGENGSGKSTFIKSLLGIITAKTYKVKPDFRQRLHQIEYSAMLEGTDVIYPELTVRLNAEYFSSLRGTMNSNISEIAKTLGLEDKLDSPIASLSTGNKRLASLLALTASNPNYLFLDEPTLGLDLSAIENVKKLLTSMSKKGVSIILTSHDVEFIQAVANSFYFISNGSITKHNCAISELKSVVEEIRLND